MSLIWFLSIKQGSCKRLNASIWLSDGRFFIFFLKNVAMEFADPGQNACVIATSLSDRVVREVVLKHGKKVSKKVLKTLDTETLMF